MWEGARMNITRPASIPLMAQVFYIPHPQTAYQSQRFHGLHIHRP